VLFALSNTSAFQLHPPRKPGHSIRAGTHGDSVRIRDSSKGAIPWIPSIFPLRFFGALCTFQGVKSGPGAEYFY
jgi:hypothetical protein